MNISRSEIETLITCETQAYETYRRDSTGYVPSDPFAKIEATQGQALHSGGALLFTEGINSAWRDAVAKELQSLPEPHKTIRTTLIRRALLGWSIKRLPQILAEWTPLAAELPWKWEIAPGFQQPLRMDDILEHKENGSLCIFDFKTAGSPDLNWTERKRNSLQTHLYVKALKDVAPNKFILGIMYDCIVIGKWDDKKEIHKSPFVTGYLKAGKVSPKWSAGSTLVDLCDYTDEKWLEWAEGTNALEELYWNTDLILPNDETLENRQESSARRVLDYSMKLHEIENSIDPETTAKRILTKNDHGCLQFGWGHACVHYNKCWKGEKLDPTSWEPRKDHHAIVEE